MKQCSADVVRKRVPLKRKYGRPCKAMWAPTSRKQDNEDMAEEGGQTQRKINRRTSKERAKGATDTQGTGSEAVDDGLNSCVRTTTSTIGNSQFSGGSLLVAGETISSQAESCGSCRADNSSRLVGLVVQRHDGFGDALGVMTCHVILFRQSKAQ